MATYSTILAWKISMDRGAWWATAQGVTKNWKTISSEILTIKDTVLYVEKTWAFGSGSDGTHIPSSL